MAFSFEAKTGDPINTWITMDQLTKKNTASLNHHRKKDLGMFTWQMQVGMLWVLPTWGGS